MKPRMPFVLTILILAFSLGSPLQAQNEPELRRHLTATLLPLGSPEPTGKDGLLWIQALPRKDASLRFDLSGLPFGLERENFTRCTLRLVAETVKFRPKDNEKNTGSNEIKVKGRLENAADTESIIALSTIPDYRKSLVGIKDSDKDSRKLLDAVYDQYKGNKIISLVLFTNTENASSLFYSTKNYGTSPSNLPRLVIEYTLGPPSLLEALSWSQHQQNPEHTGANLWKPVFNPVGFSVEKIDMPKIDGETETGSVVDYPLIYQGNIYLVYKVLKRNYLLTLDFKGNKLSQKNIGEGTIERSPVISRNGIFYIITEKQIAGYDLNRDGELFASCPVLEKPGSYPDLPCAVFGKPSSYTDLTIGNDGSLFLALNEADKNYIYGFTAGLKPFLKNGPFSTGNDKISTITVSADGRKIFAQTPKGPAVIDIANPSEGPPKGEYRSGEYYHVPVAGPADGVMVFSDFLRDAGTGSVEGYKGYSAALSKIWSASGTLVPQAVLGSDGLVYFIQGGKLQRHKYDVVGSAEIIASEKLNATSNLVMDGANNIYFWDNGVLRAYKPDGAALFVKTDFVSDLQKPPGTKDEPEQFIRLMAGPDGTLWANNREASFLYAFKPSYAESESGRTLGPDDLKPKGKGEDLKTPRLYRTTGALTVGDAVSLKDGTRTLFQAQKSIAFGNGFTVEKGASLLCRTGF